MAELGDTKDPTALVSGSVAAVDHAVQNWTSLAHHAATIQGRVNALAHPSEWTGSAAEAFSAKKSAAAKTWNQLHTSFSRAASSLDEYATALGWAQQKAEDAIAMWERAEQLTTAAQSASSPYQYPSLGKRSSATTIAPPQVDPGADLRTEAVALLAYARNTVMEAGNTAASELSAAEAAAPDPVGFWNEVGALAGVAGTLAGVLVENTVGGAINDAASFGNALANHPDELLEILGGAGLIGLGGSGEAFGTALDVTGIGTALGIPLNIASAAAISGGAGLLTGGIMRAAEHASGDDAVQPVKRRGIDRGDGRDDYGHFAPGQTTKPWVDKEAIGLKRVADRHNVDVITDKIRALVDGANPNGRYYDGLIKNEDGTYTAIEIKSGNGVKNSDQRIFDNLVNNGKPAVATTQRQSYQNYVCDYGVCKMTLVFEYDDPILTTLSTRLMPMPKLMRNLLRNLGDQDQTHFSLWKLPAGIDVTEITEYNRPTLFLQCAGTRDAMTIEWRREDSDGEERLYTVGHGGPRVGEPPVDISFHNGQAHTAVYPDEVFQHDEAADIFAHYVETLTVPNTYTLREFDLTWPKP